MKYFVSILLLLSNLSIASDGISSEGVEIKEITFWSTTDPYYPKWRGLVQLTFTTATTWSAESTCHSGTVAIKADDKHLVSAALSAKISGSTVRLYADDNDVVTGTYCYLRALKLN